MRVAKGKGKCSFRAPENEGVGTPFLLVEQSPSQEFPPRFLGLTFANSTGCHDHQTNSAAWEQFSCPTPEKTRHDYGKLMVKFKNCAEENVLCAVHDSFIFTPYTIH